MKPDANPYQSPATLNVEEEAAKIRRPARGTFLLVLCILDAGCKTCFLGVCFSHGANPMQFIAHEYQTCSRIFFFLAAAFFILETVAPWIGIYYLTGRRARTIPFDAALVRILKLAGGVTLVASLALMLYLELTASAAFP